LGKIVKANKKIIRVRYSLKVVGKPSLEEVLESFLAKKK